MTFDEIKQLLDIVREHELWEFELERDDFKIRVRRGGAPSVTNPAAGAHEVPLAASPPAAAAQAAGTAGPLAPGASDEAEDSEVELAVVKSPIVGTFYRSAEPDAPPFVQAGDTVRKNQVLCIIEAMKLMNEITSEYEGEVVKIYVENGQAVQYGERLFAIRAR